MLRFACLITGDDYHMLKSDTPSSRKKVVTLVGVMCLPVLMWTINVMLAMMVIMNRPLIPAILGGLLAGVIIFIIERSIIMANGSKAVMVFRVILGCLIAILGSVAFDEVIFKADIDQQMGTTRDSIGKRAEEDVRKYYSGLVRKQEHLVSTLKRDWDRSLIDAQREADGTGGSGQKGVSGITRLKIGIAAQKETVYRQAKAELDSISKHSETEIGRIVSEKKAEFDDHALLRRIEAMFSLVLSNVYMGTVYVVFTLILFMMEFIVVILKIYLPKSNYETKLDLIEEIGRRRMKKLLEGDASHFDQTLHYPRYQRAADDVRIISARSIFN